MYKNVIIRAYIQPLLRACAFFRAWTFSFIQPARSSSSVHSLISEGVDRLVWVLADLLVGPLEPEAHDPSSSRGRDGESGRRAESDGVARRIGVHPQVRCPHERSVGDGVDDRERGCFLLFCLAASGSNPAENDGVDGVGADGENDHGEVLGACVQGSEGEDETEDGDRFRDRDVSGALVEATRRPRPGDRDETGNEVGRASEGKGNSLVEVKGLNSSREEVLEAVGSKVHVLHECEEPELGVGRGGLEASVRADDTLLANGVCENAVVCQETLFGCKPLGVERIVGKHKSRGQSNDKGCNTLDDEKPLPATETSDFVKLEDTNGDQTSEGSSEDVASVQDGNTSGDLLASVEDGEHVKRTRVLYYLLASIFEGRSRAIQRT